MSRHLRSSRRSIRNRRKRARVGGEGFDLQLTSMMDVLVIIVVFLLKTYSASSNAFKTLPGMEIPLSASEQTPPDSLQIIVTREGITFENQALVKFSSPSQIPTTELDDRGLRIIPLFNALAEARHKTEILKARSANTQSPSSDRPFMGAVAITADAKVEYDVLRKIMYTASSSGYQVFRFLALRKN